MSAVIRSVEYFYIMIEDKPGEAYRMLTQLASEAVNLLAFNIIPTGPSTAQIVIYPENVDTMNQMLAGKGSRMYGPNRAFLITGDDELGALLEIHEKLTAAEINVVTSSGISDSTGRYGYVLHVRPEDYDRAAGLLHAE
ncbi:MAG: hypothetical protein ACYTG7_16860 [Planctomycetota bacterium]|jgi:hypothetical protein